MSEADRKIKACAEWMLFCLWIGWPKADLDALQAMWWKHWRKRTLPHGYVQNIQAWRDGWAKFYPKGKGCQ